MRHNKRTIHHAWKRCTQQMLKTMNQLSVGERNKEQCVGILCLVKPTPVLFVVHTTWKTYAVATN